MRDSLAAVRGVIPHSPGLLAYSGVQLSVGADGVVRVVGSDGETSLVVVVEAADTVAGQVLLQPKPLTAFLATLPGAVSVVVAADAQGETTLSAQGYSEYRFRPLTATYPAPPVLAGTARGCDLDMLGAALAAIRPAIPRDTLAVQVVSGPGGLVLNATDTFRLARARLPVGFGEFTGVLSSGVLERAARLGASGVTVEAKGRMVCFSSERVSLTARLLAVPFPAVDSVIDAEPPFSVSFSPRALRDSVARLASVADQAAVKVRLEGMEMRLEVSTADIGAGAEVVPLDSPTAAPFEVLVKAQYLQDVAGAFDGPTVQLSYSGALQPLYVSASDGFDLLHVVMPVRS